MDAVFEVAELEIRISSGRPIENLLVAQSKQAMWLAFESMERSRILIGEVVAALGGAA